MDLRILDLLLVFRIVLQVFASVEGSHGGQDESYHAGRDGDHQHLWDGDPVAVGIRDGHESDHSGSDRGAGDSDLGGNRGHSARPFRTDVFLDGDIDDDWHEGIDHVSGSDEDRQEEGTDRSEERDAVRMPAEQLFGQLDQPVHTAGCLKYTGAGHCCDDDVDDVGWRIARLHAESEYQDGQAYS